MTILDCVRVEVALRELIEFVDGLAYAQLDHVPGLFAAARKARSALTGDHISDQKTMK